MAAPPAVFAVRGLLYVYGLTVIEPGSSFWGILLPRVDPKHEKRPCFQGLLYWAVPGSNQ